MCLAVAQEDLTVVALGRAYHSSGADFIMERVEVADQTFEELQRGDADYGKLLFYEVSGIGSASSGTIERRLQEKMNQVSKRDHSCRMAGVCAFQAADIMLAVIRS
jgi:hypothetical protein